MRYDIYQNIKKKSIYINKHIQTYVYKTRDGQIIDQREEVSIFKVESRRSGVLSLRFNMELTTR